MANQVLSLGVLNFVAHPHPKGVYSSLLRNAAGRSVGFWGSEYAAISAPTEIEPGLFQGRIAIWAQIDIEQPGIDLNKLEEIDLEDVELQLPEDIGFNGRIFVYTLNESRHLLFVETKNEFGKNLSPRRAKRIFSALLSPELLPLDAPLVDITVVPEDDSVETLLAVHRLDKIHIHLTRPNAEEFGDIVEKYLDGLVAEGAKSQDVITHRAPESKTLKLSQRNEELAKVAAYHGYVAATGREADGKKFDGSTREYPKIIRITIDSATSLAIAARRIAKTFLPHIG